MGRMDAAPRDRTVLVVDDDQRILSLVSQMLKLAGYCVIEAAGPEPAIDAFEHATCRIDLLLSDLQMPGMDGQELCTRLRAVKPDLPVVLMTAYSGPAACPRDVLQKPFEMAELHRKVAAALHHPTAF